MLQEAVWRIIRILHTNKHQVGPLRNQCEDLVTRLGTGVDQKDPIVRIQLEGSAKIYVGYGIATMISKLEQLKPGMCGLP